MVCSEEDVGLLMCEHVCIILYQYPEDIQEEDDPTFSQESCFDLSMHVSQSDQIGKCLRSSSQDFFEHSGDRQDVL